MFGVCVNKISAIPNIVLDVFHERLDAIYDALSRTLILKIGVLHIAELEQSPHHIGHLKDEGARSLGVLSSLGLQLDDAFEQKDSNWEWC